MTDKPIISMRDFRDQDHDEIADLNSLIIGVHALIGNTHRIPEYHKKNITCHLEAVLLSANVRIEELRSVAFSAKSSRKLSYILDTTKRAKQHD